MLPYWDQPAEREEFILAIKELPFLVLKAMCNQVCGYKKCKYCVLEYNTNIDSGRGLPFGEYQAYMPRALCGYEQG